MQLSDQPKLTVVIPCYNEAANIPLLLDRFSSATSDRDISLLLVDNGSTDKSADVLNEQIPRYPSAQTIKVPVNQGYGYGILQGLAACKTEFLGWTHADLQTDPKDLIRAYDILGEQKYSPKVYVKGERRGRPLGDTFFTAGMSCFETLYLGERLWDINAQPNIFHRSFFEAWREPPYDFALDLYAYYQAQKVRLEMIRFDVLFPERIHGTSSWNTGLQSKIKFIRRTFDYSFKLKQRLR